MGQETSFSGGHIAVKILNDQKAFLVGSQVQGEVIVNINERIFAVKDLVVGLYGYENV